MLLLWIDKTIYIGWELEVGRKLQVSRGKRHGGVPNCAKSAAPLHGRTNFDLLTSTEVRNTLTTHVSLKNLFS